jgi:hypothetical protein
MPVPPHSCPGNCGRSVSRARFACLPCWERLPTELRAEISDAYRAQPLGTRHRAAMRAATEWYRSNA